MAKSEQSDDMNPAYLPFSTFQSAVQNLRDHGLPAKIDKSAFGSRSGTDQLQIMGAFKFLGLIDNEELTQPILKNLHAASKNSDDEKRILSDLLQTSYSQVFATVDLKNATPQQLEDAIGSYGIKGSTKTRAVRFFTKAAEYCGIPLSGRLTRGTRTRAESGAPEGTSNGTTTQKATRRKKRAIISQNDQSSSRGMESAMKTISLPVANGTLTLSGSFNPFQLVGKERELVYSIIDNMNEYEQKTKAE